VVKGKKNMRERRTQFRGKKGHSPTEKKKSKVLPAMATGCQNGLKAKGTGLAQNQKQSMKLVNEGSHVAKCEGNMV